MADVVTKLDPARRKRPAVAIASDVEAESWRGRLLYTDRDKPRKALANVVELLLSHAGWRGALRYNAFSGKIETTRPPPWHGEHVQPGEWTEGDDVRLVVWLERELGLSFGAALVRAAVENVARRASYHPVRDWLRSLRWDGDVRLDKWLTRYFGATAQPAEYLASVGRWWPTSAVARIEQPGCQADHAIVLEGAQGAGKSTALRKLGDPWVAGVTSALGEKDSYLNLCGRWLIELEELAGVRRSDVERVKAFVSGRTDGYRPPYARAVVDVPRQCIFAATTNAAAYLQDATGGRRFWPIGVGKIDLPGIEHDRELLWAEARTRFEAGERWWPVGSDQPFLETEQEARREVDPWEPLVAEWLQARAPGAADVQMVDLLGSAVAKSRDQWTRADETRVGAIMHRLGWTRTRLRRDGQRLYLYTPNKVAA